MGHVGLRAVLTLLGKGEKKVAVVFGISPGPCHEAVLHLRTGAPEVPVWLFAATPPLPETAALCERVFVSRHALLLLWQAQIRLWPFCVAIAVSTWTAEHRRWPLKLAPFLIPPFRGLLLNSWGGFFPAKPALVWLHWRRWLHGASISGWTSLKEISAGCWTLLVYRTWRSSWARRIQEIAVGCWLLVSYHVWRSGSVRRVGDVAYGCWRLLSHHMWRSSLVRRGRDVGFGLSLSCLSTVLRWLGYPHRGWFGRMHGDGTLAGGETTSAGGVGRLVQSLVQSFVQKGPGWDATGFAEFVRHSDARWILWQSEANVPAARTHDMLPLFADPRTFAVARQLAAREWKPALLPMAPFRHLQAGTASQVLAPLARTILVDRAKLAALGVPEASFTETAWMLAFWKAAAAGWRCYSVPDPFAADEQRDLQPDYPLQETEFCWRVLLNHELRQIGPREPDLSRGSIAFAPATQSPLRPDRLKVVVVSPFLPYPLAHGGAVRIFNLCRELADRVDFVLIAVREAHEVVPYDKLHQVFRQVYTVDIDERESQDERLPQQVRAAASASLRALIAEVCDNLQPDLLQIEFTHMAGYRGCAPQVPAILVEHDLTTSLYYQLAQANPCSEAWREYQRWLDFEQHWLAAFDAVWTVSEEDRRGAIQGGSDADRTFSIPNGVDLRRFLPCEAWANAPEIFCVGSFRHLPNTIGFQKLRDEVMPRVWQRIPGARLRVVAGPHHEFFWSRFAGDKLHFDPRIKIQGYVEDLRPLYAQAAVVVAPLVVSAGTNIKVLEAMACGKAVVTTPVGCAGLGLEDGIDAFIREDWGEFADAVCEALLDVPLRSAVGLGARRTAEARFSWTSIAGSAYTSYLALAASSHDLRVKKAG